MSKCGIFLGSALLLASLTGCTRNPDVLPIKSAGQPDNETGFCKVVDNATKVIFSIKNNGSDSPAPSGTVEFPSGGSVPFTAPMAIPAGETIELPAINIPTGCFSPDCSFKITITPVPDESITSNNSAQGRCIG